jgi:hypothetical protein
MRSLMMRICWSLTGRRWRRRSNTNRKVSGAVAGRVAVRREAAGSIAGLAVGPGIKREQQTARQMAGCLPCCGVGQPSML